MAKYVNKLDEFQSHSIHYVMLAARSTEDLRPFCENSDAAQAKSLQAIDACKQLGGVVPLGGQAVGAGGTIGDSVFLLMDTRRFSQFTVANLSMATKIAGFAVPGSNSPNAVGQELAFEVLDPSGISFANFLQYLMDRQLKVSFDGMAILVRILFVGHTDTGTTKIIQSIGIPAIFSDIQLDLNETKGVYHCKCIPLVGMVSNARNNAKWTAIGTASTYFTGVGANTLGAVIRSFESRLNEESLRRYAELNGVTQTAGDSQKSAPRFGRPVQYMITIPKEWETFSFSGPAQHSAAEINFKELLQQEESTRSTTAVKQKKSQANTTAPGKDGHVAVDPNLTVTEVLDTIFSQTIGVQELGNFRKQQTDAIKFYKQLVSVTSDDQSFTVHVDVVEFTVPNVEMEAKSGITQNSKYLTTIDDTPGRKPRTVPKNYLEFEYLFSGKNLDIINLDLKIEKLNLLLMQQTKIGQATMAETADDGQAQSDGQTEGQNTAILGTRAAKDPVPLRVLTPQERANFSNLAGNIQTKGNDSPQAISQQYTRNLSDFYNIGGQAKMTIRGNPEYFERMTLTSLPKHMSAVTITSTGTSTVNESVKAEWRKQFEERLLRTTPGLENSPSGGFKVNTALQGPSFATTPVFVKVNVYGPSVDFITEEPIAGNQNFARELFTDNFYFVSTITSKIEGAKFTQDLDLLRFSIFGTQTSTAKGAQQDKVKEVK